jgi:hypothetical protein|tara:strand:+ start:599 stop:703 length:105 start_codon:yes stop_codon:yes gene_type:complete
MYVSPARDWMTLLATLKRSNMLININGTLNGIGL